MYLKKVYLSGYLFFGDEYGPSTEGLSQIDKREYNNFLKDEDRRRRMLGLAFVAYSQINLNKSNNTIEVEINLKQLFKDINFIKVNNHLE